MNEQMNVEFAMAYVLRVKSWGQDPFDPPVHFNNNDSSSSPFAAHAAWL